jgi:hypothetical protein
LINGIIFALNNETEIMRRKHLLTIGAALILMTSCGPKRLGCHGRRYCDAPKQTEKPFAVQSLQKDA